MNKFLSLGVLTLALALTGCGGDSDSSGSSSDVKNDKTDTADTTNPKPDNSNVDTCKPVDGLVKVPKSGGCTYSSATLNSGALATYTCNGTTVSNSLGLTAGNQITLNGVSFTCKY